MQQKNNPQTQTLPVGSIPSHSHGIGGHGILGTTGQAGAPAGASLAGWITVNAQEFCAGVPTAVVRRELTPSPLSGRAGKQAFMLHPDGRIEADWRELMAMKDEYLAGNQAYAWAAALWLARNTR